MFRPTRLYLSECVEALRADWNTCPLLLLHSHFQQCFYLLLPPPPPPPPPPPSFPIPWPPLSSLLPPGDGKGSCIRRGLSTPHFHVTLIEPAWQSKACRKYRGFAYLPPPPPPTTPPLSWTSVWSAHATGGWQKVVQCTLGMDGSLGVGKEAEICLRTVLSLCCIWSGETECISTE